LATNDLGIPMSSDVIRQEFPERKIIRVWAKEINSKRREIKLTMKNPNL